MLFVQESKGTLHEQLHRWSWSGFGKPFGKMASLWEHVLEAWRRSREKPLFLAHSHPKALWEHVFRGFIGRAVLFYPVWQKTAPSGFWSRWRSPAKRDLSLAHYFEARVGRGSAWDICHPGQHLGAPHPNEIWSHLTVSYVAPKKFSQYFATFGKSEMKKDSIPNHGWFGRFTMK